MVSRWQARLGVGCAVGALLLGSATAPSLAVAARPNLSLSAPAAPTFTVNSQADVAAAAPLTNGVCETAPGNHTCTLRAAIMKANHFPGGGVTIDLPAGTYDLSILPSGSDDETSGDLNITNTLTLNGAGAGVTFIDAHQIDPVFNVTLGAVVTLADVTLRDGRAPGTGGGLQNSGTLTLDRDVIEGNQSGSGSAGGGVVSLNGSLTLNNTIVRDNFSGQNGGGVFNNSNSNLTLNNSVISGNQTQNGGYGGGLFNAGALTLNNSLVSGNQATGKGGGITNFFTGVLTSTNSTISNNSAQLDGGGLYNQAIVNADFMTIAGNLADSGATGAGGGGGISNLGTLYLKASLLGQNDAGANPSDGAGTFNSLDYNLIQTTTALTLTGLTAHNVIGSDPQLDVAQDNGGATPTRALLAGSPAIDVIPMNQCTDPFGAPLTSDQRGFLRPVNGACDIGAFEGQLPALGYLRNLVRNGDAEAAAGSPGGAFIGIPNWHTSGQLMTVVPYNAPGGFPSVLSDTVPASHGDNFFAGGVSAGSGGHQVIDLSPLAASIDAGGVGYDFSADLGGYFDQGDNASVEADFLDGATHLLSQVMLGPVTATDRGCPGACQTTFLHRDATGLVPLNTRSVELFVTLTMVSGPYDDGYADNIALVLLPKVALFLPLVLR